MSASAQSGRRMTADVAVVGLGAMGSSVLYQLARRGVNVIGIDRFDPPHASGSSHGGSRVTREAVGEGPAYVPLVQRSHAILADLEEEFGEPLLVRSGTLIVGSPSIGATPLHGATDFLATSIEMAERFGIRHEVMNADELRKRFPQFRTFRDTDRGYLEPQSGYIRPEATIKTQLDAARARGARTLVNSPVLKLSQGSGGVSIETKDGVIEAGKVVVTAGAWTAGLLGAPFTKLLKVSRQVLHWFEATDYAPLGPDRFPVFIWFVTDRLEDYFTGFPVADPSEGFKVTASRDAPEIDHEAAGLEGTPEESREFYERHVRDNLAGITPRVISSAACFYTSTPDNGFIIDTHPGMDRVTVVSACSGHGFKHAVGIGEAVAEKLYTGESRVPLTAFGLGRFAN